KNKYDSKDQPIVIVAFDVRIFKDIGRVFSFLPDNHPLINLYSSDLARIACEIYTGNGFTIYTSPEDKPNAFLSTPELSFLIKHYKAIGGINISASHNHPDDNGFKFYNPEAAQDIPPEDEHLDSYMNAESLTVNRMDYQTAKNKG
ncbi:Alpha-D-phosphohexomutase, alpha/beta/alpha domain protein I domain protein, partial [Candidatus Magnetomorum sp. HK-1]